MPRLSIDPFQLFERNDSKVNWLWLKWTISKRTAYVTWISFVWRPTNRAPSDLPNSDLSSLLHLICHSPHYTRMHPGTRFTNLKRIRILLTNQLPVENRSALLHFIDSAPRPPLSIGGRTATALRLHLKQLAHNGTMTCDAINRLRRYLTLSHLPCLPTPKHRTTCDITESSYLGLHQMISHFGMHSCPLTATPLLKTWIWSNQYYILTVMGILIIKCIQRHRDAGHPYNI